MKLKRKKGRSKRRRLKSIDDANLDWPPFLGRPSKYDPKYCAELIKHVSEGDISRSFTSFAAAKGLSRDTIHDWALKHPDFSDARKKAKEIMEAKWMQTGAKGMTGGYGSFHNAAWIFWGKACFGWSDDGPQDQEQGELEFVS